MNVSDYLKRREQISAHEPQYRDLCTSCLQPDYGCYCSAIEKFNPQIEFVILIHPIEVKRRIATGRMSHLCLENSHLIKGEDYSENAKVNELLSDPAFYSMILYPGFQSTDLTPLTAQERQSLFPQDKKIRLFVIDGTWASAKKMMRKSRNLHSLPKICFSPSKPSGFKVRKQPHENCFSTIEAIHEVIELAGAACGYDVASRKHDNLLAVFGKMVDRQLAYVKVAVEKTSRSEYRRFTRMSAKSLNN
ncbi:DTW domain protein [compost metagenome]